MVPHRLGGFRGMTLSLHAPAFSLEHTLESGQFFRYSRAPGGAFTLHARRRLFRVEQAGETLLVDGADAAFVRDFFSLDHDLPAIRESLARDPKLRPSLDAHPGLRLLRQDPWECTAAFILSIASNIPRIAGNVADLARAYGGTSRLDGLESPDFPLPRELGGERELRRLRVGFRASYLVQAARLAQGGLLEEVEGLPYEEAKEALMVIPGVAEKVADCVLLFAFGHLGAFPVDTWIRKVMIETYFGGRQAPDRAIRAFAQERWGDLAGYAQQYLYHASRKARRHGGKVPARSSSSRGRPAASPA
jgi:N-glycosylase/DNA lyase